MLPWQITKSGHDVSGEARIPAGQAGGGEWTSGGRAGRKPKATPQTAESILGHLDRDNHAAALDAFRGMTKEGIERTWREMTGRGFYNQSKQQMLAQLEQYLPRMTKTESAARSRREEQGGHRSKIKHSLQYATAHASGHAGAPISDVAGLSEEQILNPHDPAHHSAVQAAWRRVISGQASKLDESDPESRALLEKVRSAGYLEEPKAQEPKADATPAAPAEVPERIKDKLRIALHSLREHADALERGRQTDRQFGGGGRYEAEIHQKMGGDKEEPETIRQFRELAKKKGIDADAVLAELGGVPDLKLSPAGREYYNDLAESKSLRLPFLVHKAAFGKWNESDHPRETSGPHGGQFRSGGSVSRHNTALDEFMAQPSLPKPKQAPADLRHNPDLDAAFNPQPPAETPKPPAGPATAKPRGKRQPAGPGQLTIQQAAHALHGMGYSLALGSHDLKTGVTTYKLTHPDGRTSTPTAAEVAALISSRGRGGVGPAPSPKPTTPASPAKPQAAAKPGQSPEAKQQAQKYKDLAAQHARAGKLAGLRGDKAGATRGRMLAAEYRRVAGFHSLGEHDEAEQARRKAERVFGVPTTATPPALPQRPQASPTPTTATPPPLPTQRGQTPAGSPQEHPHQRSQAAAVSTANELARAMQSGDPKAVNYARDRFESALKVHQKRGFEAIDRMAREKYGSGFRASRAAQKAKAAFVAKLEAARQRVGVSSFGGPLNKGFGLDLDPLPEVFPWMVTKAPATDADPFSFDFGANEAKAFDESKHPRGQPENAGEFASGGGGRRAGAKSKPNSRLPTTEKDAAAAIVEAFKASDPNVAGSPELQDKIRRNWTRNLKGTFSGLPAGKRDMVEKALSLNHSSAAFRSMTEKFGPELVLFRNPSGEEDNPNHAGISIGPVTHIFHSPLMNQKLDAKPEPGETGGLAGEIRHEYGHRVWSAIGPEKQAEFAAMLPSDAELRKELTDYAGRKKGDGMEPFCELFAIVTHPQYDPSAFPKQIQKLGEWVLSVDKPKAESKSLHLPFLVHKQRDASGHEHATDGRFGHTAGSHPSRTTANGKPVTPNRGDPDEKAAGLAKRVREVPRQMRHQVTSFVRGRYRRLAKRYGPKGALAILGATVLLLPTPVPGSSLIPIAVAEAVLAIRRAVSKGHEMELDEATIQREAKALLADLMAHMGVTKGHDVSGQPRDVDGTWMSMGEFGSHPADEYEATDFAHAADRDYVRRVHDKYHGAPPERMKAASSRAFQLAHGAKKSGKHELARRYSSAARLLMEMAQQRTD